MKTTLKRIFCVLNFLKVRILAIGISAAVLSVTVYAATVPDVSAEEISDKSAITASVPELPTESTAQADATVPEQDKTTETETPIETAEPEVKADTILNVTVMADGKSTPVSIKGGTVKDALKLANVTVDSDDLINYELDTILDDADEIIITRVSYETSEETEVIPFEVVEKKTPLLRAGKSELFQTGKDGKNVRTYKNKIVDGVVVETELVSEVVTETPASEVTLVHGAVPVSDLDFESEIVNHAPVEYTKVIKNARATGYSAGKGAWGASGNHLFYGHVAVNPNVIPYNSKLYIASEDGKFIYGYAIASDTGTALMNGVIDVDLYYETFRESQLNGVRRVNIYVLE